MPVANERRQALQPYNDFVVLHRRDALAQVGYRPVEFRLADEMIRISVFRRDLVSEKLEILSPLFRRQSWKRSFTVSKVGSEEKNAEQVLHKQINLPFERCECIRRESLETAS
jgi:hypothetical protein